MNTTFGTLVTRFFVAYLAKERGLSKNTIAAYSDCMRLLVNFVCTHFGVEPEKMTIEMITFELILKFLDQLEQKRKNMATTRNQRLAAIKTFFHFLARNVPELMRLNERIQAIRPKKTEHNPPFCLTVDEINALIAAPSPTDLLGVRDKALLQTLYNTGARVQEIADLAVDDIRFDTPASVTLTGKGRKRRVVPLWTKTLELLRNYLEYRKEAGIQSGQLFVNNRGNPMTRFGIGKRVALHAKAAAEHCPSLQGRAVTPHVIRHTTALHLIEADNDIAIVKDWLGHSDMKTTSQYFEVSIERKRKALDKVPPPTASTQVEPPKWKQPAMMKMLLNLSRNKHYVA